MRAKTTSQPYALSVERGHSAMRSNNHTEASLSHAAFRLIELGAILLLIEIVLSAYAHIYSGGPFAASSHFSGTEGYRFIATVGLILANGLVYSLNGVSSLAKMGKAMGWLLAGFVLWQVFLWYSAYRNFGASISFQQVPELATMVIVLLAVGWMLIYIPYNQFFKNRTSANGIGQSAQLGKRL